MICGIPLQVGITSTNYQDRKEKPIAPKESKQAAYRRRQNQKLRDLRIMEDLVANRVQLGENGIDMEQRHWFGVDISLDRKGKTSTINYMMEAGQLSRFLDDIKQYNTSPSTASWHGTYAMADPISDVPGMATLAFIGLSVTKVATADDYQTPSCYSISEGAVNLIAPKH